MGPILWPARLGLHILRPALATDTVCCSMASWTAALSCVRIVENSSTQQTPPSANTKAPASPKKRDQIPNCPLLPTIAGLSCHLLRHMLINSVEMIPVVQPPLHASRTLLHNGQTHCDETLHALHNDHYLANPAKTWLWCALSQDSIMKGAPWESLPWGICTLKIFWEDALTEFCGKSVISVSIIISEQCIVCNELVSEGKAWDDSNSTCLWSGVMWFLSPWRLPKFGHTIGEIFAADGSFASNINTVPLQLGVLQKKGLHRISTSHGLRSKC